MLVHSELELNKTQQDSKFSTQYWQVEKQSKYIPNTAHTKTLLQTIIIITQQKICMLM